MASKQRAIRAAMLALAVPAAAISACGSDDAAAPERAAGQAAEVAAPASTPAPARTAAVRRGRKLKLVQSQFGRIVGDGRGQAVYVFDAEESSRPECYGACAKAWPPVLSAGRPVAGRGVRAGRLGTTRRRSGKRQVTLNGRPLYYYVHDAPGRVLCHDVDEFGGLWLVVRSDGTPVP